jgi:flavodoxin
MRTRQPASIERRAFLRLSGWAAVALMLGCSRRARTASATSETGSSTDASVVPRATSESASSTDATVAARKALLVFFSRAGENYFHGGRKVLTVGNTAVVAGMIRDALGCDAFQIQPVDPYSDRYEPTVKRNAREQEGNARPGIVGLPASIAAYDTILIGSPIWNVRAPRIMLTFAERFNFTGKTVYPFTTHAMSGLGHVVEEYTAVCRGATIGEALAIRGEEAADSRPDVDAWLRRIGLRPRGESHGL